MTKFNIGDTVYQAEAGQETIWVKCPECLGSGRLRVILGDESEVSIACECCSRGFDGSLGKIQSYAFLGKTTECHVTGVESQLNGGVLHNRYSFGHWSTEEENLFPTREAAANRVVELIAKHEVEEKKRLAYKEKQYKTWAWHVSYWRGEIRRAKETIARSEARLAVAPKTRAAGAMRDLLEADTSV